MSALSVLKAYIEQLESCQDGYYRADQSDEAKAAWAVLHCGGWQPIDSAPTDGSLFVAWAPSYEGLPAMYSLCAWHPDAGFCIDELRTPRYWMPLPPPPMI